MSHLIILIITLLVYLTLREKFMKNDKISK